MLSWIGIDGAALRHNYRQFCQIVGKERVAPVLKANAYGHGLREVYTALSSEQPAWICTNYVAEGRQLRELGYRGRVLVVGPAVTRELREAAALDLELVIGNFPLLTAWLDLGRPGLVHVKFDTGMSRQGFPVAEAARVAALLHGSEAKVAGLSTHFANVEDVTDPSYAEQQLRGFRQAAAVFTEAGFRPLLHAASSASALLMEDSLFDLVRVGISLYGVWPSPLTRVSYLQLHAKVLDLHPVLSWHTEVTTVKPVAAGQFIGYGCTFRAVRDMRVVIVPVGYYEGFPRLAGEAASFVLIHGQRCPVVGRVCMNMLMADTTHLAAVEVGDPVTLIGIDGADAVSAQDLAGWARTIHYELLARLPAEIPRRLRG